MRFRSLLAGGRRRVNLCNFLNKRFRGSISTKWFFGYLIPGRIGIWKCCFLRSGENRGTPRKTSRSQGKNQQETNSTHILRRRRDFEPGATLVGDDCSPSSDTATPLLRNLFYKRKSISYFLTFQSNCYAEG